ncbi:hypothetical protein TIFTF001_027824 [Ficus carica]|uniref:Uncharacterized protein n=1 Tax=Ficus carica TaxID=3494 RepID=A0AA88DNN9_FICCA|nr:hypothetical protein TIFTF001_027824 [Ficus carica]
MLLLFLFIWSLFFLGTFQLQSSQTQVLLQLKKHLEYPKQLEVWQEHGVDFCYITSSSQVNLTCQENVLTELRIIGDKPNKMIEFNGLPIPTRT